jgi:hypothetical protein
LGKLVSPIICVGQFNHQNYLGTRCKPNSLSQTTIGAVAIAPLGTPDSLVCQPRHPTVRVLTVSTVGALTSWGTGHSGAAPDKYCLLSGAPVGAALTLRELSAHCSCHCSLLQTTVGTVAVAPLGTPDSPVNFSGVCWRKPEAEEFRIDVSGASDTVWCARPGHTSVFFCSFLLNPNLFFLLVCVEPLAPIEHII